MELVLIKIGFAIFDFCKNLLFQSDGINYIDSTKLEVCHIKRASSHKTFKGLAAKGHTSVGWFHGFKLHLINNAFGLLLLILILHPEMLLIIMKVCCSKSLKKLQENFLADRGYLIKPELFAELLSRGITMISKNKSKYEAQNYVFYGQNRFKKTRHFPHKIEF